MCEKLEALASEILKLSYSQEESGGNFEQRISSIIKKILRHTPSLSLDKSHIKGQIDILQQPNGTQQPPDFRLYGWEKPIMFETKRSRAGQILWNDNYAKIDKDELWIYIYNGKEIKISGTTFSLGSDLISVTDFNLMKQSKEQIKQIGETIKETSRGERWMINHIRPQFCLYKDKKLLSSPNRIQREKNVIETLKNIKREEPE